MIKVFQFILRSIKLAIARIFSFFNRILGIGDAEGNSINPSRATNGYKKDFFQFNEVHNPSLSKELANRHFGSLALKPEEFYLEYNNYSLLQSPLRRFPIYTSTNIDGKKFKKIDRKSLFGGSDKWKKDDRIAKEFQLGNELYSAEKSDFDKGHLTKREDTQWGNLDDAKEGAISTFFFTNAVPQMAKLNRGIWKNIENYILKSETIESELKISMFTGPILHINDPVFVTPVKGQTIKLPIVFWKIVYYEHKKALYRTGFIAGQGDEMIKNGIIARTRAAKPLPNIFNSFEEAETYQVQVNTIETLTGLTFEPAEEVYQDERPTKLILEETQVRGFEESISTIRNLVI